MPPEADEDSASEQIKLAAESEYSIRAGGTPQSSGVTHPFAALFINNGPGVAGGIGPGGVDGNVGLNSLLRPGFKDLDMGVFRNISFEHGVAFRLRDKSANALKWVNFRNPTESLASGN